MMDADSSTIITGAPVLAVDLTRLRTRVNGVRSTAGISVPPYTDSPPTTILAIQITELRARLTEARAALGLTTPAFTDPVVSSETKVKAAHFNELLDGMR